jgi:membrane protease YdiL (CAAX protease family)
MKKWKLKLILTGILFLLVAIVAFIMHQHIVATSPSPDNIDARDDSLASLCGVIVGSGLVLIWLLPFLQKIRRKFMKS